MSTTEPSSPTPESAALYRYTQPSPAQRLLAPRAAAVCAATVVGFLISPHAGAWIGFAIGVVYVIAAGIAAGHYALDLHNAEVLDSARAPETTAVTEEIATELGILPPDIYRIDVERPQMCVSAVGAGRHVHGRIGVSRALLQQADEVQLRQLLALAMARIWTGEATIMSAAAALAGLPLQFAQSKLLNGSPDWKMNDLECGLSPFGKFVLVVVAPFSRMILRLAGATGSVFRSDQAALRLGQRRFHANALENAIRWLHDQQSPVIHDPITVYNPAEVTLFLVSPFEVDFQGSVAGAELPLWKRARFLVTSVVPHMELRIQRIRERASEMGPPKVRPTSEPVGSPGGTYEL
jgi:Zn-dependent protease with chaperone function